MSEDQKTPGDSITVQTASEPSLEALEREYNNALDRIDHQHEVLKEFSREGMKMFRILILFIAIPATILGAFSLDTLLNFSDLLLSTEIAVSAGDGNGFTHEQIFVSTGFIAILSIAFHIPATGQEFKGIRNQTNPNDIGLLIDHDITEVSYLRMKLELLRDRIEENRKVIRVMEDFLAIGKACTLLMVIGVGVIFYNIATGGPVSVLALLAVLLIIAGAMAQLPTNYMRADRLFGSDEPYDNEYVVEVEE